MDGLRWNSDWSEVSDDVFRDRVADASAGDAWTFDGNYGMARDLI